MKTWLAIVVGGAALLTAWALPPESPGPREARRPPTAERQRANALRQRLELRSKQARRVWWGRTIAGGFEPGAGPQVETWIDLPEAPPGDARAFGEELTAAVDALPGRSDVDVGLALLPLSVPGLVEPVPGGSGRPLDWTDGALTENLAGEGPGGPWCVTVRALPQVRPADLRSLLSDPWSGQASRLGVCAWWAVYGVPGPRVREWLGQVGYRLGADLTLPAGAGDTGGPAARPDPRARRVGRGRPLPARPVDALPPHTPAVQACLAGDESACVAAVTDPEVQLDGAVPPSRLAPLLATTPLEHHSSGGSRPFRGAGADWLPELEREFGPDAFEAFWTSPAPVEEAFRAAFGVSLGEWTRRWALERFPPERAGPLPTAREAGGVLLWALAGVGAALVVARRRRVAG